MTDRYYQSGLENGVRFDDPALGIPLATCRREMLSSATGIGRCSLREVPA